MRLGASPRRDEFSPLTISRSLPYHIPCHLFSLSLSLSKSPHSKSHPSKYPRGTPDPVFDPVRQNEFSHGREAQQGKSSAFPVRPLWEAPPGWSFQASSLLSPSTIDLSKRTFLCTSLFSPEQSLACRPPIFENLSTSQSATTLSPKRGPIRPKSPPRPVPTSPPFPLPEQPVETPVDHPHRQAPHDIAHFLFHALTLPCLGRIVRREAIHRQDRERHVGLVRGVRRIVSDGRGEGAEPLATGGGGGGGGTGGGVSIAACEAQ